MMLLKLIIRVLRLEGSLLLRRELSVVVVVGVELRVEGFGTLIGVIEKFGTWVGWLGVE